MRLIDADELMRKNKNSNAVHKLDIVTAPTIEAKPVVRGEWEDADSRMEYTVVRCSNCGKGFGKPIAIAVYNYCPACGADMRGENR